MIGVAIGQQKAYSYDFPAGKFRRQAEESRPAIVSERVLYRIDILLVENNTTGIDK